MEVIKSIFSALFFDTKTGTWSNTKVWMHVGYIVMTYRFVTDISPSWEVYTAYGGIVAGSHVAMFWLKRKYDDIPPQ